MIEKKNKIVFLTPLPSPYQVDLFNAISKAGYNIKIIYTRKTSPGRSWKPPTNLHHPHLFLPEFRVKNHWYFNGAIHKLLNEIRKSNLLIITQYSSFTFQFAMYFASFFKKKWIYWSESIGGVLHEERPLIKSKNLSFFFRKIAVYPIKKWAFECWAIGTRAKKTFQAYFPNKRIELFYYYSDLSKFRAKSKNSVNNGKFHFIYIGSLIYRKGFDILIDGVRLLHEQGIKDFYVHIFGEGNLKADITDDVSPYFKMYGFVSHEELISKMTGFDVFVFPTRYDGWGLAIIEALSLGLPVICSDKAGAGLDVIEESNNGWVFNNNDANALKEIMKTCMINKEFPPSEFLKKEANNYDITSGVKQFSKLLSASLGK